MRRGFELPGVDFTHVLGNCKPETVLYVFLGMNSILLYVGHGILWRHFPFSWETDEYGTHEEKLTMNLIGTALWVAIAYYLFRKKFFLKV